MRIKSRNLVLAALAVLMMAASAQAERHGAVVVSPKQKDVVRREAELLGKVLVRGWPVVMVKADLPAALWWAQEPAEATKPGHFRARVRFGNEASRDGTFFKVVVLMLQSPDELKKLGPGTSLKDLPESTPRSAEIRVELKQHPEPESLADVIQSPKPNQIVGRVHTMSGRVEPETVPIVLVRSASANSQWWVQQQTSADNEGLFQSTVRFGNDKSEDLSQFRLAVLLLKPGDPLIDKLVPGVAIKQLPSDLPRSREVRVTLKKGGPAAQVIAESDE